MKTITFGLASLAVLLLLLTGCRGRSATSKDLWDFTAELLLTPNPASPLQRVSKLRIYGVLDEEGYYEIPYLEKHAESKRVYSDPDEIAQIISMTVDRSGAGVPDPYPGEERLSFQFICEGPNGVRIAHFKVLQLSGVQDRALVQTPFCGYEIPSWSEIEATIRESESSSSGE